MRCYLYTGQNIIGVCLFAVTLANPSTLVIVPYFPSTAQTGFTVPFNGMECRDIDHSTMLCNDNI